MWTRSEIWQWLQGKRENARYTIRKELEIDYKKQYDERMQKIEDDAWSYDINYRAEKLLTERNNYIKKNRMLEAMGKIPLGWSKHEPLLIPDLGRSAVYTIYNRDTAKYLNEDIEVLVWKKFNELKQIKDGM